MTRSHHLVEDISQALIAFTIEYDNDWEKNFWIPLESKPLRVSMVMWENFLRFVPDEGISLRELSTKAGYPYGKAHPCVAGMLRWRFVTELPNKEGKKKQTRSDYCGHTGRTACGRVLETLASKIETRWDKRFGNAKILELKKALVDLVDRFDIQLPHYFPVLGHLDGMRAYLPIEPDSDSPQKLALPNIMSKVVHRYTLSIEEGSEVSLVHRANVLRILTPDGIPVRQVPQLAGISKEALKMAYGFLMKSGHVVEEPSTSGRGKQLRLTKKGIKEQARYDELHEAMEKRWEDEYSAEILSRLRKSLDAILESDVEGESPLFQGLAPVPGTWRAEIPKLTQLPHHPMVLHRGGWPDGS